MRLIAKSSASFLDLEHLGGSASGALKRVCSAALARLQRRAGDRNFKSGKVGGEGYSRSANWRGAKFKLEIKTKFNCLQTKFKLNLKQKFKFKLKNS